MEQRLGQTEEQPAGSARVLIVDDHDGVRQALGELLQEEGFPTATVRNGEKALEYLRSHDPLPCLILLDLMMPGMSGWSFRVEQLKDARLADIPVILISGIYDVHEQPPILQVDGFLRKPIDPDVLLQVVKMYCT